MRNFEANPRLGRQPEVLYNQLPLDLTNRKVNLILSGNNAFLVLILEKTWDA